MPGENTIQRFNIIEIIHRFENLLELKSDFNEVTNATKAWLRNSVDADQSSSVPEDDQVYSSVDIDDYLRLNELLEKYNDKSLTDYEKTRLERYEGDLLINKPGRCSLIKYTIVVSVGFTRTIFTSKWSKQDQH